MRRSESSSVLSPSGIRHLSLNTDMKVNHSKGFLACLTLLNIFLTEKFTKCAPLLAIAFKSTDCSILMPSSPSLPFRKYVNFALYNTRKIYFTLASFHIYLFQLLRKINLVHVNLSLLFQKVKALLTCKI